MISGSLCRHLKIAGRFVIEVSSPYQPRCCDVATQPYIQELVTMTLDDMTKRGGSESLSDRLQQIDNELAKKLTSNAPFW